MGDGSTDGEVAQWHGCDGVECMLHVLQRLVLVLCLVSSCGSTASSQPAGASPQPCCTCSFWLACSASLQELQLKHGHSAAHVKPVLLLPSSILRGIQH